jgi:hypothetical protein
MSRFLVLALAAAALAGCTMNEQTGVDRYTLMASGIPTNVAMGENFTFQLTIAGPVQRQSDHISAHFWSFDTMDPTANFAQQAGACVHVPGGGPMPGEYSVVCKFTAAGMYYVHGHARYSENDELVNWWTSSLPVTAA